MVFKDYFLSKKHLLVGKNFFLWEILNWKKLKKSCFCHLFDYKNEPLSQIVICVENFFYLKVGKSGKMCKKYVHLESK